MSEVRLPTVRDAELAVVKCVQSAVYNNEIKAIKAKRSPTNSNLSKLCPFLDSNSVLRVAGRLKESSLDYNVKHPIILPKDNVLTMRILSYYHELTNHQGRHITHSAVRSAGYFIEKGSSIIKKFINSCVMCRKLRFSCAKQLMADLPSDRVEATPPFLRTGLDVMGPWVVSDGLSTRHHNRQKKFWAVLFTCLASRAVHIELIPSMDTSSMKNALTRFTSVRGHCELYRSDRGTNFVAADKEVNLDSILDQAKDPFSRWIFNPPNASHFGGVWERKIGQLKRALDYSILKLGKKIPTFDELQTFMQEACAVVNSTPLWQGSYDPLDPLPLSPSMLITQKNSVPETSEFSEEDLHCYGKRRWRRIQHISDIFWKRWRLFYLQDLQIRQKWITATNPLEAGDYVLIKDKNLPRKCWASGLIVQIKKSNDNLVRSAKIKICKAKGSSVHYSIVDRPISSLVLLLKSKA